MTSVLGPELPLIKPEAVEQGVCDVGVMVYLKLGVYGMFLLGIVEEEGT